jgi:hypothetical protein
MRQRQRALDVVGYSLAGSVRDVVDRQNHHVISDTNATVLSAIPLESKVGIL